MIIKSDLTHLLENDTHPIDIIRNPPHYKSKTGLEAIDVIEAFDLDFNLGNAVKYILRSKNKNKETDLKKARQYLNRAINGTWDY